MYLYVKEGVTIWNIIGMAMVLPTMLQMLTYLDVAFVYLIQNENYFNIPNDEASIVAGDIIFYMHIICLCKYFILLSLQFLTVQQAICTI